MKLIYGYDPICGWCYAFAPQMARLHEMMPEMPIEMAYGGLVVGERVQPIAKSRGYLTNGEQQLKGTTGVEFGEAFKEGLLAEGTHISDSEPPCRAVWTTEQIAPEQAYAFANDLPHAHYWRGLPLDNAEVLGELAAKHGIDVEAFVTLWDSDEARAGVQEAFAAARQRGISSYPTLIFDNGEKQFLVARGWDSAENIQTRIQHLMP